VSKLCPYEDNRRIKLRNYECDTAEVDLEYCKGFGRSYGGSGCKYLKSCWGEDYENKNNV